ncbi:salicylate synthase [Frankia sp. QA3]|uniref:salicylate synthase n=1 Tax=Frankia sp. QA3 TaxID=710111 RepID=UPI000269BAF0|nr:salicylate synthase [Frankia sp. QA3]EIV91083.1 salicylate synthase [Frankia sp. QA3]
MTASLVYRERAVPFTGDPLAAAARLARGAEAPFTVYERDGEWCYGSGALAEIVLYWDEIRYRSGGGWRVEPVASAPLRALADVLATIPVADWRAYGWAGFELGPRTAGLPGPRSSEPLVHLIIPAREVRLTATGAALRAADPADLDLLAEALAATPATPATGEAARPRPLADLEHGADDYRQTVARAVEDIRAGRLRKVILSRVVPVDGEIDLVATYERGRRGNTPARSFLLDLGGLRATGFSPETVVEVASDGRVSTQPLAGTAAFDGGQADGGEADRARREALRTDPKEIYEHAVSVQVAQEELRLVCQPGTLVVDEFMAVLERGSVQHLASRVSGRLAPGHDGWDALAAVFPSITATGVPKAAAFAAIRRYEPEPRGLYSGAVISAAADGSLDAALVLRTAFQRDGRTWLRAGAGVVGASRPERELEETREKLRSVSRFLVAAPPAGPDREALRRTVADMLEEDPADVGDEDNLFERGLESIALIQTVGAWRRAGMEVNFAELAENPTIDAWFKLLAGRPTAAGTAAEVAAASDRPPEPAGPAGRGGAGPRGRRGGRGVPAGAHAARLLGRPRSGAAARRRRRPPLHRVRRAGLRRAGRRAGPTGRRDREAHRAA